MRNWHETFYYDETSPSFLRWSRESYSGRGYGKLQVSIGDAAGSLNSNGQYEVWDGKRLVQVHRIIYELFNTEIPEGMMVDHKDGNRSNNQKDNLRVVSNKVNTRNQKKRSTNKTGITGVYKNVVKGTEYYTASWTDECGVRKSKSFGIEKHGEPIALYMASEARQAGIELANKNGAGYTERHGT